jgi:acyl-CoA thioester hydrolase
MPDALALPALDLSAPFDRHEATVLPEWLDYNGHMNVGYYIVAFDKATDTLCEQLGVAWDYVHAEQGMVFVIESHATYDRELRGGAPIRISSQIVDFDAKRLHLVHRMRHGTEGWLAATNELLMIHIDFRSRRSAPWPRETMARIGQMAAAHKAMPPSEHVGRRIGIRRKP